MKYRLIVMSAFAVFAGCKTAVMKSTPFYEGEMQNVQKGRRIA